MNYSESPRILALSLAVLVSTVMMSAKVAGADSSDGLLTVNSSGDLTVEGKLFGGTFFMVKKDDTNYQASPLDCVSLCAEQGARMATLSEMYAYASGGHGICAKMWVLDDPNTVAAGYPQYKNVTDSGQCGKTDTGNVPRIESLTRNQDWCSTTDLWNCGCTSLGQTAVGAPSSAPSCGSDD